MTLYTATVHAEQPITLEINAASDSAAQVVAMKHSTGGNLVTLVRHDTTPVGGHSVTYEALVARLWNVVDGLGERDTLDTFAMLMRIIQDIEAK